MKWTRLAIVAVFAAGLAAFRLQAGPGEPARVVPPSEPLAGQATDGRVPLLDGAVTTTAAAEARDARRADGDPQAAAETGGGAPDADRAAEAGAGRQESDPPAEARNGRRDEEASQARSGRRDDDRRDRRRRWRRNRYPGPIPSPADWEPPEGPVRIGLQVGHWRTEEAPRELSGLRGNGTRWGDMHESEVNLQIARRAGVMLEEMGYEVDLLPAVVPPGYRAHLFISIHADGSNDPDATGYRVAAPRRDATGRADEAVELLERTYGEATGLPRIPTVTRRMRSYYAFNFRRYEHALHPMTIGVIIETGFLTNGGDRRVIVDDPDRAARGIVDAVAAFPHTPPPDTADRP